ncbi:MAG: pyridoxal phosphate-dependent aminotransferase [Armatimonadetes bacterium]|nr:pyridoxal phosphate-dependent aminotransferase [Armatimonadota bacterium]
MDGAPTRTHRLSDMVMRITASMTIRMEERAKALAAQGVRVVAFAAGEPDFDTPEPVKEAAIAAIRQGFTKYTASSGIRELREAIAAKLKRDQGLEYAWNEIVVSNGGKQALYNAVAAVCGPEEEVIIPSPCWVTFPEQVKVVGGTPVLVPARAPDFVPDPADVAAKITPLTRAIVMNSPNNPTGAVYTKEALSGIADLALRHNLYIIVDEIYQSMTYDGTRHYSIPALRPDARELCLLVNSMSKAFAMTGWRVGSVAGPREVIEGIDRLQGHVTGNPNSIAQKAAVFALTENVDCTPMVREYDRRRKHIVGELNKIPGFKCAMPKGAFYAFPDITALLGKKAPDRTVIKDSMALAEYFINEAHVVMVPGDAFFGPGHLRLSYATSMAEIDEGLARIRKAVEKLA